MKRIFVSLICLFIMLPGRGQFNMPALREVVSKFYATYSFERYGYFLKFYRNTDGWWVAQYHYADRNNYFAKEIFWSRKSRSYLSVNYSPADSVSMAKQENDYLRSGDWEYEEYAFRVNKYYGYPGWDWDVIEDSADLASGVDSLLECQGRAYSNYASGFIAEQFGDLFVNGDPDREALKPSDPISTARIDKFIYYDLRSIEAYKKLLKINPAYETRVGNIKIKCANEYLFMYSELMLAGDTTRASQFASQADYPDSLLKAARYYLNALPMNSILITGGDNDTYPVWYLQNVEKFRKDVIVLNYSMLGFRKYLLMIDRQHGPTLFSTRDSTYLKDNFDYSLYANSEEGSSAINVDRFLKDLGRNFNPFDTAQYAYKNELMRKYYTKEIFFERGVSESKKTIVLSDILMMNEYILLDIINSNAGRNIFFTFPIHWMEPVLNYKAGLFKVEL